MQTDLSIIIVNYNSGQYLKQCLESIATSNLGQYQLETIVVDNASTDTSVAFCSKPNAITQRIRLKLIKAKVNLGFAKGNNLGIKHAHGTYILFLNPDTKLLPDTLATSLTFLESNKPIAALTCFVRLVATNQLQPEAHRGFPTPWRSFCHFSGLEKLFPQSKLFAGYFQTYLPLTKPHPIEACVGAFLLVRKQVGVKTGWWDEAFYWYGEDLDFCYRLHQHGFVLYFLPTCEIAHYQGISSGIKGHSQGLSLASHQTKLASARASTDAMSIFYRKHYFNHYPKIISFLVLSTISLLATIRQLKIKLTPHTKAI